MSTISADNADIQYSPYTWGISGGQARTINAGAYFRIAFTGTPTTAPTLGFDVSTLVAPLPRIAVSVDGGPAVEHEIAASIPAPVPAGNSWGVHTIEVTVVATTETQSRWPGIATQVRFTGLTADVTITSRAIRARAGRVLAVGDSIAEGVRTLNKDATDDTDRNDARQGWAYLLGDALGMEVGVVGFGGVGIAKGGSGNVPRFADSVPYLWSGVSRDLTAEPSVIVAHIGTNDGALADADVTTDTTRLLDEWITTTAAPIVVLPGWLQRKAGAIQAGIAACSDPARVTYVDTTGWWATSDASDSLHPYGYINEIDLVPRLAEYVAAVLGGYVPPVPPTPPTTYFINRGGVPRPIF